MLGLAEYSLGARDLLEAAIKAETGMKSEMPFANRQEAIRVAQFYSDIYNERDLKNIFNNTFEDIAENAFAYYEDELGLDVNDWTNEAKAVVAKQYNEKYYGATLSERLRVNARRLGRNIVRSAAVGAAYEAVVDVLTKPFPFGAQNSVDKRLLQATAMKIEQDVAKIVAERAGQRLIRWRLSSYHKMPDICDDLASNIDKNVVLYMEDNGIDADPRGVYFIEDLPLLPHPNCMCEFGYVVPPRRESSPAGNIVKKSVTAIGKIIQKLRRTK